MPLISASQWGLGSRMKMTVPEPDTDYPVFVAERNGEYYLRIRELLLTVRGASLQKAYEELMRRKQEIIDSARAFGTLDELPEPKRPALFRSGRRQRRSIGRTVSPGSGH